MKTFAGIVILLLMSCAALLKESPEEVSYKNRCLSQDLEFTMHIHVDWSEDFYGRISLSAIPFDHAKEFISKYSNTPKTYIETTDTSLVMFSSCDSGLLDDPSIMTPHPCEYRVRFVRQDNEDTYSVSVKCESCEYKKYKSRVAGHRIALFNAHILADYILTDNLLFPNAVNWYDMSQ